MLSEIGQLSGIKDKCNMICKFIEKRMVVASVWRRKGVTA